MGRIMYCVYLTIYTGNKLPPFYIGSTSTQRINKGYRGSVSSVDYKKVFNNELKASPELFLIKIIKYCDTRKHALIEERKIQSSLNVINNPLYMNRCYAHHNYFGEQSVALRKHRSQKMKNNKFNNSKGKICYKNEKLNLNRRYFPGTEPDGFVKGRIIDIETMERMKQKCRKSSIVVHKTRSKEDRISLFATKLGFKWYYNEITGATYYGKPSTQPANYKLGRKKCSNRIDMVTLEPVEQQR